MPPPNDLAGNRQAGEAPLAGIGPKSDPKTASTWSVVQLGSRRSMATL